MEVKDIRSKHFKWTKGTTIGTLILKCATKSAQMPSGNKRKTAGWGGGHAPQCQRLVPFPARYSMSRGVPCSDVVTSLAASPLSLSSSSLPITKYDISTRHRTCRFARYVRGIFFLRHNDQNGHVGMVTCGRGGETQIFVDFVGHCD